MMDNVGIFHKTVKAMTQATDAAKPPHAVRGWEDPGAPQGTAAFAKAMHVLDLVAAAPLPMRFTDLQKASGLPRATLHRLLAALLDKEMIAVSPADGSYQPGPHLLELAGRTWERMDLRAAAARAIEQLSQTTQETIHVATLSGDSVVYIDKVECAYSLRLHSAIGKRGPVHCTAVGKVMAAFLDADDQRALVRALVLTRHTETTLTTPARLTAALASIRAAGIAFDLEEHVVGIHCAAAPIFDFRARCVGGISLTAPKVRVDLRTLKKYAELVRDAAADATRRLGGRSPTAVAK